MKKAAVHLIFAVFMLTSLLIAQAQAANIQNSAATTSAPVYLLIIMLAVIIYVVILIASIYFIRKKAKARKIVKPKKEPITATIIDKSVFSF
jgi:hypothetical protein